MSTSQRPNRPKRKRPLWRSDAAMGLAVVLAVVALNAATDFFSGLERRFYDLASTQTSRLPSDRIAVIAIDDQSVANIGRWPWPREVHAQLIDQLGAAGAKTVAHTAFFFEPQTDRGLVQLRELRGLLDGSQTGSAPLTDLGDQGRQRLLGFIGQAERQLDSDARLVASMARAGNVIVPSVFELGEPQGRVDQPLPAFAQRSAVADNSALGVPALRSQQPLPAIGEAARAVGHLNQLPDVDGAVRQEGLLVQFDGFAVPSMALAIAANSLNLTAKDMQLLPGEGVQLGRSVIPTDSAARLLPQFYPDRDGKPAFAVDSFYDVLSGRIPASKYADKIVIIGATAAGVGTLFTTPVSAAMSPAAILAHITSSILSNHHIVQPLWGGYAVLAALLLIAGYIVWLLPRLSAAAGAACTAALFVALLGAEFGLLSVAATWLPLVFPASLLLIGHLALTTRRFLVTEAGKTKSDEESAETNRMMGLALQGQGQLDMAFDRMRRVPFSDALMDNLKHLALDFERKRQFNKAEAVYEHMAKLDRHDADVQRRLKRARNLSETVVLGGGSAHPGGTLLLDNGGVEKPMLGRYQVEKELGKGAMGVVYQGRDPKIGRTVAIKTLALSAEFEGSELVDVRERFFREAETAGRLQHPNIVTIFDAGEEHDLAFIAMEFLPGRDLVEYSRPGNLLPVATVLSIGEQVALALEHAHRQQVVHRDIKPANVMFDTATQSVKVTDFGIARITGSSKTKTGMVLGTPSFMSPEQLAGLHVDGRSDLYSLGVMLFQLLTGSLPLKGDSMAALMYQIANQPAPSLRSLRPDLSQALADVLERALAKSPADRFQSGAELAAQLRRCVGSGEDASMPGAALATTGSAFEATHAFPHASENAMVATLVTPPPASSRGS
ncbi:CHASE2 domain-containing serine/threonine-protein kinase [Hydrogenophaga sp.]|uniref:CHASE2 domain-containing serine/threonine-protein kinase n=1 Tax=Hydrogenophaga sp. TaxID=1904254 RepID=UPI00271E5F4D|nr:serine/threonine-protein kinase [Hydrogenophaga sp.]MDO9133475.1 serine/threonine-protein kinase [Hydrogenophaga sp.]